MKITDLLKKNGIALNPNVKTKEEAINKLVDLMNDTGRLNDKEAYKEAVLARESLSTTGIGDNIAIPHAKTTAVKEAGLSAMILADGIDYDSLDGEPAKLFFMIAAPEGENNLHLDVLARLSMMLMDPEFKEQLINAKSVDEFLSLIDSKENDKLKAESDKEEAQKAFLTAVSTAKTNFESDGDYRKYDKAVEEAEEKRDKAVSDAKRAIYGEDYWRY